VQCMCRLASGLSGLSPCTDHSLALPAAASLAVWYRERIRLSHLLRTRRRVDFRNQTVEYAERPLPRPEANCSSVTLKKGIAA
jgi:hypothetical protein